MTARVEVPSGMANAAAATSTRQPKVVSFFIKPRGIQLGCRIGPLGLTRYESIVCRPNAFESKLKYTAPVDGLDTDVLVERRASAPVETATCLPRIDAPQF